MNIDFAQGGAGGGAERRRYARLPIKLDALVAIDGRPPIPCTVRDFCVAGIFVAIPPQQLRLVKAHTSAKLLFCLVVDGAEKEFELILTIFRIIGGGFGCGFENADPAIISLLQNLATNLNAPSVAETEEDLSRT